MGQKPNNSAGNTPVTAAFLENESILKRFLNRFLPRAQDIEDVVQDTFIKAHCAEKTGTVNSPKAFLFRIARNEALKELRRKSNQITAFIEDVDGADVGETTASAEEENIAHQRLGLFCQSVLAMPPRCRRVFLMCKIYGMSYKDIADELGISVSGVEKHVAKGLQICNAHVEEFDEPRATRSRENRISSDGPQHAPDADRRPEQQGRSS